MAWGFSTFLLAGVAITRWLRQSHDRHDNVINVRGSESSLAQKEKHFAPPYTTAGESE